MWVPDLKAWVPIGNLRAGSLLQTSSGTWVQATAVRHYMGSGRVYDLTIDTVHTFYVVAGTAAVLVHNCDGINVHTDDYGQTWARVAEHPYDHVIVERNGGTLTVKEVFREEQEEIRGSDLLAAALRHEDLQPGEIVILDNVINEETLGAYEGGLLPKDSKLGHTIENALDQLGLSIGSMDWYPSRDRLHIVIEVH